MAYYMLLLFAWLAVADITTSTIPPVTTTHGLKEAMEQTTVLGRIKKYDEITGVKLDKPRYGVMDPKDAKMHEGKIDPNAPHEVQEEQIHRSLRTYIRIPNPIEYEFASSGDYFHQDLYSDPWCAYWYKGSYGLVNGKCATLQGMT